MIENDDFGLGDWELIETSEQAMLAQVTRAEKSEDAILFLAWAPHPMNVAHDITYLAGGDEQFGPNYGGADVFTLARTGWAEECPNAAQFFRNLTFTVDIENEMMALISTKARAPTSRRDLAQGPPRRARPLARGRDHPRGRARPSRRAVALARALDVAPGEATVRAQPSRKGGRRDGRLPKGGRATRGRPRVNRCHGISGDPA